uniref:CCC domain-containing protein n=1 Tax=Timema douglasi TaxID=61478 RepID=A0A7R8Z7M9_TIMDO|nr:unnamed protein product [Timema douglasi]
MKLKDERWSCIKLLTVSRSIQFSNICQGKPPLRCFGLRVKALKKKALLRLYCHLTGNTVSWRLSDSSVHCSLTWECLESAVDGMVALWSPLALILLVVYCACPARQDMDVLEHMVSEEEATLAATNMNPQPDHRVPGCAKCSYQDIYYCVSYQVLEDHCCCDKRYLAIVLTMWPANVSARVAPMTHLMGHHAHTHAGRVPGVHTRASSANTRDLQRFPYVPHACYLSDGTCSTIARNCEEEGVAVDGSTRGSLARGPLSTHASAATHKDAGTSILTEVPSPLDPKNGCYSAG